MIKKLTQQQEKQITKFIDKYVGLASKPTNRKKATEAVQALYKSAGEDKPIVIYGKSPFQTAIMVAMCKILFKDEIIKDDSQLSSQLGSQLSSQLGSQLSSQLSSQLDSQLDSQLRSQLSSQLRSQLSSHLSKINNDWWLCVWWLVWAGWYAYGEYIGVKFVSKVLKTFIDFVTNVSFCIPYKGICFVSETPTEINWEDGRLSKLDGPAVKYADDYSLYSIHGVKFTEEQFKKSKKAKIEDIIGWEDIDQRSALLRDRPIEQLLKKVPKTLIDETKECGGYKLYEIEIKGIGKARLLSYKSWSSKKMYAKFVAPTSNKCLETVASLRHQSVEELKDSYKS